jgi:hydrogenase/urease accessory protein HupE
MMDGVAMNGVATNGVKGVLLAWVSLAWAFLALARSAPAHDLAYSSLEVRLPPARQGEADPDTIRAWLVIHTTEVAREIGLVPSAEDSLLDRDFLSAVASRVRERFAPQIALLTLRGAEVPPLSVAVQPDRGQQGVALDLRYAAQRAGPRFRLRCAPFPRIPEHQTFVSVYARGTIIQHGVLAGTQHTLEVDSEAVPERDRGAAGIAAAMPVVRDHLLRGLRHILAGPDHLLFLLALILYGGSLPRLMNLVALFAIAQSLTLTLSLLPMGTPPPRAIDAGIALVIAGAGVHNLRQGAKTSDRRALLALAFGLLHGWGWGASQLGAGAWALNAFTIGVVLGQVAVVLALAPLFRRIGRASPRAMRWIVRVGSWAAVLAGAYWLVC